MSRPWRAIWRRADRDKATFGVDFGTSNASAAVAAGGRFLIALEGDREVMPTAFFVDHARPIRSLVMPQWRHWSTGASGGSCGR